MTSEKIVTEYQRGFPTRKWKKIYRNEVLDCRVYASAALLMREVNWKALLKNIERKKNPQQPKDKPEAKPIESKSQGELIHVTFTRGIRWKGSHTGPGSELDVTIQEAKELLSMNAIKDVKLPQSSEPLAPIFKIPSTKQLRRGQVF